MGYHKQENYRIPEVCEGCPTVDIDDPAIYLAECETRGGQFTEKVLVLADPDNPTETAVSLNQPLGSCSDAFCQEHESATSASLGCVHEAVDACEGPIEWKVLGKFVTSTACGAKLMPAKKYFRHQTNAIPKTMQIDRLPVVESRAQKEAFEENQDTALTPEEIQTREDYRVLYHRTLELSGVDYLRHKRYINAKTAKQMQAEIEDENWQAPESRTINSRAEASRAGMEAGVPECLLQIIRDMDISGYLNEVTTFQRFANYNQDIFPLLLRSVFSEEAAQKWKELSI